MTDDYIQPPNIRPASVLSQQLKSVSKAVSMIVIGIGCLGLLGWMFNLSLFKSIVPGLVTMKANTAIGFIISGASLYLWHFGRGKSNKRSPYRSSLIGSQVLAVFVIVLALLTIIQYGFNLNLGIDQLVIQERPDAVDERADGTEYGV